VENSSLRPRKVIHTNGFRLNGHFYIILPATLTGAGDFMDLGREVLTRLQLQPTHSVLEEPEQQPAVAPLG
jgi:hypothetical protein